MVRGVRVAQPGRTPHASHTRSTVVRAATGRCNEERAGDQREPEVVDARSRRAGAVHDHARQHRRQRRAALDPARSRRQALGARVDRLGLRPYVRGAVAHRWQARRPPRTAPDLRCRPRRLLRLVPCLRARAQRRLPRRGTRRPGRGRRAHEPGHALDHLGRIPASPTRHGDRHLGRRLGDGARDRPARRRAADRARRVELDLLHQRPDRGGGDPRELPS
jgi:hypothetical protein